MEWRLNHSFVVTIEAMFSALLSLSVYSLVLTKRLMLCKCKVSRTLTQNFSLIVSRPRPLGIQESGARTWSLGEVGLCNWGTTPEEFVNHFWSGSQTRLGYASVCYFCLKTLKLPSREAEEILETAYLCSSPSFATPQSWDFGKVTHDFTSCSVFTCKQG